MLKEIVVEKLGIKLIEKGKEILFQEGETQIRELINQKSEEHIFVLYRKNLDEELLKKYGNEIFYDDLCRVLLKNNNLETLLKRCKHRDLLEKETDLEFLNRIMNDTSMSAYNRQSVKIIIEYITEMAFKSFNDLKDPENIMLQNIMLREGEKTRQEIRNIFQINNKDEKKQKSVTFITRGCKNPVKHFLGRENDIELITNMLDEDFRNNCKSALWIYGMGGMGKTQLCRKLFSVFESRYQYIGWVTCQGDFKQSLVNGIIQISKTDDLEKEYEEAINYLNSLGKQLLVFIDNYDAMDHYIEDIESLQCHVIVTSRNKNPDTFTGYELGFLAFPDCKNLFRRFYTLEDNIIMNEIIHKTGYLALAVELVAKTGQKMALSLKEYYEKLEEKGFDIATVVRSNWDNKGKNLNVELAKHFGMVFDLAALKNEHESLYILKNFSILPYLGVTQHEVVKWFGLNEENNYLTELADSGWLQQCEFEYTMHPIISFTVRKETHPMIQECSLLVESLSECIRVEPGDNYLQPFKYLPYANSVGEYFVSKNKGTKNSDNITLAMLYIRIAEINRHNGEYKKAYEWGNKACELLDEIDGEMEKEVILKNLIYNVMSEICLDMRDRNEESKDWATLAIKSERENVYVDDVRKSTSFHNLACAYIQMGKNEEALENEKQAVILRKRNLPEFDIRVLNAYRNLAMIYRRLKKVNKADYYQKKVINILEQIHADDKNHPDFPVVYSLYSFILRDLGKIGEAIEYQKKATQIREFINEDDPKLAINYNNLGVFNMENQCLEEAQMWQKKAIQMDIRHRGPNHPDVAVDLFNYAKILKAAGRTEKAIECLLKSRRIECKSGNRPENIEEIDLLLQQYSS